jgi:hypothetical protein
VVFWTKTLRSFDYRCEGSGRTDENVEEIHKIFIEGRRSSISDIALRVDWRILRGRGGGEFEHAANHNEICASDVHRRTETAANSGR